MSRLWAVVLGLALTASSAAREPGAHVALLALEGPIGPASAGYFQKAQAQAIEAGASLIVLRLDTPGGLDSAMRDIVKSILASPVPVIGYVAPGGARAASAGTYILYATHLAAMAPATNLGAATPIPVGGSSTIEKHSGDGDAASEAEKNKPADAASTKSVNDAVAYIRGLAEKRGRNADWAERAVREGVSLSAAQAVKLKVVDLLADDVPDLLRQLDGRSLTTAAGTVTLKTAGLAVEDYRPDWRMQLLAVITNPTIAYVLLLAGIYGLLLEGYHPGAFLPGVVGAIALLLALYAFQLLPVNYAGLGLILLGVVLLIVETTLPTFGAAGFGGLVAFVLGSVLLMDRDVPGYAIHRGVIAGIALGGAALMALTLSLALRARRAPTVTGTAAMLGRIAEVLEAITPDRLNGTGEGWAWIHGERWRVRCACPLAAGARVRVMRIDGLTLTVEPI